MARLRLRSRLPLLVAVCLLVFLCVKKGSQRRNYEVFIQNVQPKAVWNYVADFNNIAKLNPRIKSWELIDEAGNLDRWSYRLTSYEGMMGEWFFGLNVNHGVITVVPTNPPNHFSIDEDYVTDSFRGLLTVVNNGKMNFVAATVDGVPGTMFKEEVGTDCPLIFALLCNIETDLNRADFMKNLVKTFVRE